jgi:nucleotide-binding universal stress UspA family protein
MNWYEFRRILLAVDGSTESANAVELVADFAPLGTSVKVIHIWPLQVAGQEWFSAPETRMEAESLVEGHAARLRKAGLTAVAEVRSGPSGRIYQQIIEAAEEFACDLIAMGSRGRSDLGGLFLGSVSHQLMAHTTRPVLIARAAPRPAKPQRRVLLAIAGGEEIATAVPTAIAVSRRWGAEVLVLHVSRVLALEGLAWTEPASEAQAAVDAVLRELRIAGVSARGHVVTGGGSVASEIAEIAEVWDADLIVMGSRRLGELQGLLTGATDHQLVHRIQTPVLIAGRSQGE